MEAGQDCALRAGQGEIGGQRTTPPPTVCILSRRQKKGRGDGTLQVSEAARGHVTPLQLDHTEDRHPPIAPFRGRPCRVSLHERGVSFLRPPTALLSRHFIRNATPKTRKEKTQERKKKDDEEEGWGKRQLCL